MKVFSNTTPFISLGSAGLLSLLPSIFGEILVAPSVSQECSEGARIFAPGLEGLPCSSRAWPHSHESMTQWFPERVRDDHLYGVKSGGWRWRRAEEDQPALFLLRRRAMVPIKPRPASSMA